MEGNHLKKNEQYLPVQYPHHLQDVDENHKTQFNKILIEQPIQQLRDPFEIYDHDLVIQKVFLKHISGYPIPHLLLNNAEGQYFAIPLFGLLSLTLGDRQCLLCTTPIPSTSYFPYCTECYNMTNFYGQMCRFEGPGKPFDTLCTKATPPCSVLNGPTGCFKPHYLYIASIGSFIKVGISSERRVSGRYARLMEQGIRRALVVRSFSSLHDAINAETLVAGALGLPVRITTTEKAQGIQQPDEPIDRENHWIHEKLRKIFPDKSLIGLKLFETPDFIKNAEITVQTLPPTVIEGEILYSLGKFIFITLDPTPYHSENEESLVMLDSSKLQGYPIILQESD